MSAPALLCLIALAAAAPLRAQVVDAGLLPKPNIPYDWHTYVYAAHRSGGSGTALTARADTWAGKWGAGLGLSVLSGTGGRRDHGVALVGMHSIVDAGNSFDRFGVQVQAGASAHSTRSRGGIVDARAAAGLVTRLSPFFLSGQMWVDVDVIGHDLGEDASLRGGAGAGLRMTLHEYLERAGFQLHGRFGTDEKPAFEIGIHYSTG
ncbi:MAG TPA: hypothetical protein VFZ24_04120 [Longimicrobiales bacterium]